MSTPPRARVLAIAACVVVAAVACGVEVNQLASSPTGTDTPDTALPPATRMRRPPAPRPAQQVAISLGGVLAWDPETGALALERDAAIPSGDWSTIVAAPSGSGTTATATDAQTGVVRWTAFVDPGLRPRVVSHDGGLAVFLSDDQGSFVNPPPDGNLDVHRQVSYRGRSRTTLRVVGAGGLSRELAVDANVEPEAFALDGSALFVIQYTPAAAPTAYRVRQLDLTSGALQDVFTVDRELLEDMPGAARRQVRSRDGKRLYTLYTEPPAPTAAPASDEAMAPNTGHAFVHVLDTDEKWAMCIDLPVEFAGGTQARGAIAVSADGGTVVAADSENQIIASVDTDAMVVTRQGPVSWLENGDQTAVTIAEDGTVFAATHDTVHEIDPVTLQPRGSMTVGMGKGWGPVATIDASTRPGVLAAASSGDWAILYDTRTRQPLRSLAIRPNLTSIAHLGPTESRLWRVPGSDKCTC